MPYSTYLRKLLVIFWQAINGICEDLFHKRLLFSCMSGNVHQTQALTSIQLPTAGTWTCNPTIVQTFNVASTESTVDCNMYLSWSLALRAPGQRPRSCVCWNWRWLLAACCAPWSSWPTWSSWRHLLCHPSGPYGQLGHLHLGARALTSENYLLGNCPASYKVSLCDGQVKSDKVNWSKRLPKLT